MTLTLRPTIASDLPTLLRWQSQIHAEQYMSRYAPRLFLQQGLLQSPQCLWYIIQLEGQSVGTLWLEKEHPAAHLAILGIYLGDPASFGRGIGQQAIRLALREASNHWQIDQIQLNVRQSNTRAIACYQKVGFKITGEGRKALTGGEEIPYFEMCFSLGENPSAG